MALNAYTIYGNPLPGESRSVEDIHVTDSATNEDEHQGRIANQTLARFVPARGEYDELGRLRNSPSLLGSAKSATRAANGIGDWYSSLQRTHTEPPRRDNISKPSASSKVQLTHIAESSVRSSPSSVAGPSQKRPNWFTTTNTGTIDTSSQATLADMIRRDPPNPQNPMTPPVYYAIGPTNRGYEMLSKGGWREGQPLGPRRGLGSAPSGVDRPPSPSSGESSETEEWKTLPGSMPKLLVPRAMGDGVDVIDLVGGEESEEEVPYEDDGKLFKALHLSASIPPTTPPASEDISPGQEPRHDILDERNASHLDKPLLTPIAVALKNDRAGLGLSKNKRLVTHSSLALHQHIQHGKLERRHHISEMRRMERDHRRGQYGRGKRAYARMAKEDAEKRKRMMEYMSL